MIPRLTPDDVLAFLLQVESGAVVLTAEKEPQLVYAGHVRYLASNGWLVTLFNDCGEFDYLDSIDIGGEEVFAYDEVTVDSPLFAYHPSDAVAWERWRIPGHMHFKCRQCSVEIRPPGWGSGETLCVGCGGKAELPRLPCVACGRDTVSGAKLVDGVCEVCQFEQQVQQLKKEGPCQ